MYKINKDILYITLMLMIVQYDVYAKDNDLQNNTGVDIKTDVFKFRYETILEFDNNGKKDTAVALRGTKFRYVDADNGNYKIDIINFKDRDYKSDIYVDSENDNQIFTVNKKMLNDDKVLKTNSFIGGQLLIPIKIRYSVPKDSVSRHPWNFSQDFNLSQYFGYRFNIANLPIYLTLYLGGGVSTISVERQNAENEIENLTTLSLTTNFGFILNLDGIELIAGWGHDFMPGSIGQDWLYNRVPWFGVGLGFNLTNPVKPG